MISQPISLDELRHLSNNVENRRQRAEKFINDDNRDNFDNGYTAGILDVLRWLAGDAPTYYLTQTIAD